MTLLKRRPNPPQFSEYQQYKPYLREDFIFACVYCATHENEFGGPRNFGIDHFRPKSKAEFKALISVYANLLYACNVCNSFKLDDWPSDDPIKEGKGYLDPCEHDYEHHFVQMPDFGIKGLSQVANYMIERLHLNRPQLRKLRQRRKQAEELYKLAMLSLQENLSRIEVLLNEKNLTDQAYVALQKFHNEILAEQQSQQETWQRRSEPLFSLDDYR